MKKTRDPVCPTCALSSTSSRLPTRADSQYLCRTRQFRLRNVAQLLLATQGGPCCTKTEIRSVSQLLAAFAGTRSRGGIQRRSGKDEGGSWDETQVQKMSRVLIWASIPSSFTLSLLSRFGSSTYLCYSCSLCTCM